ncbi:MAG: thiamine pyrophosphate-dependent enzyme, partial [Candidatus Gastranaerophilaceae bacterium]
RRTILITGEGSHQLTATEIGNMMRLGVKPIVIVLNNSGYTVERLLSNEPYDEFNDIIEWNYSKLPEIFAGDVWIAKAQTDKEFDTALKLAEMQDRMCYIEICTEKMDYPQITGKVIAKLKKAERV